MFVCVSSSKTAPDLKDHISGRGLRLLRDEEDDFWDGRTDVGRLRLPEARGK